MQKNSEEFAEYHEDPDTPPDIDYAHPAYYAQTSERSHTAAQPGETTDPTTPTPGDGRYPGYADDVMFTPYDTGQVQEYAHAERAQMDTSDIPTEQARSTERKSDPKPRRKGLAGLGGLLVVIGGWLVKLKSLLFLLKFGVAGFTALLSVALYSVVYGWPFAIGIVVLLFIHEMGHAVVIKLKGIPVGGMVFIPMLGAVVTMRNMPKNARDEAEIGIAGPIAGTIASSVCLFLAEAHPYTPSIWAPLAYFGFFINLFNLIPIVPFDGGRVLAAIDRRVWIVGFLALLGFQIWSWINGNFSIWLLLFVLLAATQLWSRGLKPKTAADRAYYAVPLSTRVSLTLLYFGLAAVLFLAMGIAHGLMLGL